MRHLQIKANLVAPILHQGQLFGLLMAHHCQTTHDWQSSEISFIRQLAAQFGAMLDRVMLLQAQEAEAEHSQLVQEITLQIAQAQTPEAVLSQLPVQQIRQILKADRVIIYRFDQNWQGTVTLESVDPKFPAALGAEIYDPCFEKDYVTRYQQGRIQAIADIHRAGLTECHLKQLEPFGVRANLVAPILQNRNLLGLLIAHQCSSTRNWQKAEIDFFAQVAAQIGLALDRYDLLEQKELAAKQAQDLAEEQRQQKEALQSQLIRLLDEVEEVAKGDLTVRAEVFAGEIGIVADFFNAISESLRRIVTNVKRSAAQVNTALNENEAAVHYLAEQALQQTEETAHSLELVQQLNHSIQVVAESAHQAETVAQTAATAAVTGETAMNLSVQNILNLRSTTEEAAKKVKRLGEASQQISRVVGLIDQFALQTNLLAVNAGLEASRAGEQAQGFAVIAEEIAGLAAQCTAATQEITGIARKIEVGTREVVKAIEQSTAQVVEGTHLVEETKQSLGQMLQVSSQINQLVHSISTTTVSQVQISQEVAGLMQKIARISEGTLQSSQQVSNSLHQMIEVEQELQASMSVFKVDP
jgi:methyl-accepting chemotaxis protein